MENGLTASDVALMTRNNDAWSDNGFMWIFALLILAGGGFGFGRNDGYGQFATAASQQEILFGQQFQGLDNKIDRLGNGIADATFALNNAITTEGRSIQTQLANCCCENQRNTDALRYDMSQMFATANATTTAMGQKILDAITGNRMADMQNQINQLQLQNAVSGMVKYPMSTAYCSGSNPFCGCGCGNV